MNPGNGANLEHCAW